MKPNPLRLPVLAALLLLAGCVHISARVTPPPEDDGGRVRAEIVERGAELLRYYSEKDAEAASAIFAEDAHLMPPGVPAVIGREAIRGHMEAGMALGGWEQSTDTEAVSAWGGQAVERGTFAITFVPPTGGEGFTQRGRYLIHWRLDGDEWLIADYMATLDDSAEGDS